MSFGGAVIDGRPTPLQREWQGNIALVFLGMSNYLPSDRPGACRLSSVTKFGRCFGSLAAFGAKVVTGKRFVPAPQKLAYWYQSGTKLQG